MINYKKMYGSVNILSVSVSSKHKRPNASIALLFLMLSFMTLLSAEDTQNQQYQLEVVPQWYSTDNYIIEGPIGLFRRDMEDLTMRRYYARPSVSYSFSHGWSGRAAVYTAYNDIDSDAYANTVEIRPYFGVNYYHNYTAERFERLSVQMYLRVEDRIVYDVVDWEHNNNFRGRLKVSGIYDFTTKRQASTWRRTILSAEVLRTYYNKDQKDFYPDENFDVETRVSLAIERTLKNSQALRLEASWRYQVPFNEISNVKSNIFVFRVSYYPVWGDIFRNILFHNNINQ
jgi:hypothetical protein